MFLTLKQVARKVKKSEATARIYLDRFCIKKIKLKNTGQIVYDIPIQVLEKVVEFSTSRRKRGNKKGNREGD